jgi:hypothetical protein
VNRAIGKSRRKCERAQGGGETIFELKRGLLSGEGMRCGVEEVAYRHPRDLPGVLKREEESCPRPLVRRESREILPTKLYGAGRYGTGGVPHERMDESGFPGTIRAHEGVELPGSDSEAHVTNDLLSLNGDREIGELKQGAG